MAEHDLEQKAADAIRQVIIDAATGIPDAQIFTDFNSQDEKQAFPCVSISAEGGEEDGHDSGNFRLGFLVTVKGVADATGTSDNPRTNHAAKAAAVFDSLYSDTLAADLTAAEADFTCFNSIVRTRSANSVEGRHFETSMVLEFSCCPSDLS